jgi:phage/plasmid-like protein (TIGR03299 family)
MAHQIGQHDVTVYGQNLPAWHGLGTVFPGLMSPMRAHAEGVGLADVYSEPVVINGRTYAGYKALIGQTQAGALIPLSIVGEDYGVLKDRKVFEMLEMVYGGRACVETAGTLRDGKRLWVLVKRSAYTIGRDAINTFDLWVNRHDGSGCFELHRTNVRVVCANTWNAAIGKGRNRVFGVRHTVNVEQGAAQAINLLLSVDKAEKEEQAKAQRMAETLMTSSEAIHAFKSLLGIDRETFSEDIPAKTRTQLETLGHLFAQGAGNIGRTRWDAFNAVTEFVDHFRSIRVSSGRNRSEVRFESVLTGSGDDLKARAFDLLAV